MNCKKMRNKILLAESGELTEREERKLEAHLTVCSDCRAYRENEREIVSAALNAQIVEDTPKDVLARIRSAGEKREKYATRTIIFRPVAQALMYAATLALVIGGWTMLKQGHEQTSRMNEIGVILDMVSDETMIGSEYYEGAIDEVISLQDLADQLLIIEGLMADDIIDGLDEEDLIEDSRPAVLQSRNIPALCVKRCV